MRRLPSDTPTWKSYGFHKACSCLPSSIITNKLLDLHNNQAPCGCSKKQHTSVIDNAYLSLSETAELKVLEDAISDHYPILVSLDTNVKSKSKTKTFEW